MSECLKCFCGACPERKRCRPCQFKCGEEKRAILDCNVSKHKPLKRGA